MIFHVAYSASVPRNISVGLIAPPNRELWTKTESKGHHSERKHRKWVAILDREQFDEFVHYLLLEAEDVKVDPKKYLTFKGDPDCISSIHVTPQPDRPLSKRNWRRVRKAMLRIYGSQL